MKICLTKLFFNLLMYFSLDPYLDRDREDFFMYLPGDFLALR